LSTKSASTQSATSLELSRLRVIAGVLAACGAAATLIPYAERVAPWVNGEGVPVARLFAAEAPERSDLPAFAEASGRVAHGEGTHPEGTSKAPAAVVAQARALEPSEGSGKAGPAAGIAPSEYEGVVQPIEGAEHLAPFFKQLARTLRRESKAITRIAHYGDSAVAADSITSTARRLLQQRFGDSGHGFILIARGPMQFYMHRDVVHRSQGNWEVSSIVHAQLRDGRYGYGGVQSRASGGASATFGTVEEGPIGTSLSRLSLFYQKARGGGGVQLRADGETVRTISTGGDKVEDAVETIEVPDGPHQFSLRLTGGTSKLYGVALDRDVVGVVYDSLGLVGAMAARLLDFKPEHIAEQLELRDPHLLILGFGGNESANRWLNVDNYEKELGEVVTLMRAGNPERACMLFGPLDQGERDKRGKVVTVEVLPKIIDVQRRVADKHGCAFFDTYLAMGGEGSMARWLKMRPRLATSDMRHATPEGYEAVGTLYYKALLQAFAEHLERGRTEKPK
jgi:lysophospholipase L1-like esterase